MFAHVFKTGTKSGFAHVFKRNPYHDAKGRFSTADAAAGSLSEYGKQFEDPPYSVDDVMSNFSAADRKEIEEKIELVKNAPTSKSQYNDDKGAYTPERLALHKKIIDTVMNDAAIKAATPEPGVKPTLALALGRPGAGKSTFVKDEGTPSVVTYNGKKYLSIDSDVIKSMLIPPYKGWNAATVHEESTDVFDIIDAAGRELGLNIFLEGTLKTRALAHTADHYKAKGYNVEALYLYVPRKVSAIRAVKRYLQDGPSNRGRLVPPGFALEGNISNEKNFDLIKSKFNSWVAYDSQNFPPKLIAKSG